MDWQSISSVGGTWTGPIKNLESKQAIAKKLAERLQPGDVVGVGSGSTSFITIQALSQRARDEQIPFVAIPTSHEVGLACASAGVPTTSLMHKRPNWCFDGCDEVDNDHNMIKGRGAAMYREKLLMRTCPEIFICADTTKIVDKLGENFAIPIEVYPEAISYVLDVLNKGLGAKETAVRPAQGKDGPVVTETGNLVVDARFDEIHPELETQLATIVGVVESGLFCGYEFELVTD